MSIKIGLDAGHGLKTAGKETPSGIKEWTLNDKVRDKTVALLSEYDCEFVHTDNNEGNTDESLASRLNKYLDAGVKAFVSLHHNALKGVFGMHTGIEVYVDKNATQDDLKLANLICEKLSKYTGLKNRGVKSANYTVITQNKIPAVLVEGGFMDGSKDYKVITSDEGQNAYARAVAEALIEFLNLKKKVVPKSYVDIKAERLAKGSKGKAVTTLQTLLVAYGYGSFKPDGSFGKLTEQAVKDFQAENGTGVDGIVGVKTWSKLLGTN